MKIDEIREKVTLLGGPYDGERLTVPWRNLKRLVRIRGAIYAYREQPIRRKGYLGDYKAFYCFLGVPSPLKLKL